MRTKGAMTTQPKPAASRVLFNKNGTDITWCCSVPAARAATYLLPSQSLAWMPIAEYRPRWRPGGSLDYPADGGATLRPREEQW
jgi:hypothetical protein